MSVSRRGFVRAAVGASIVAPGLAACGGKLKASPAAVSFDHGVASGDPLQDKVIIWTRISTTAPQVEVIWQVATDAQFEQTIASGSLLTDASRDFTIKVDVTGLASGSGYFYRFTCEQQVSATGRTQTLPDGSPEHYSLAVVSCSNLPQGYFNAYRCIAQRDDVDVVLHLGDYIYEYANSGYGDGRALGRVPRPDRECVTLDDYRQRYACYREDQDLAAVHARHPFIVVWDDHEFANNAWLKGAQNHDATEGDWGPRRAAASQAYFEWLPIREAVSDRQQRIYRSFQVGDLFDLIMLDTRSIGRDQQLAPEQVEQMADSQRSLLGTTQEYWLAGELAASKQNDTLWRVLGQQVVMSQVFNAEGKMANTDFWDGYPACRGRIYDQLQQQKIQNNVVLTGDVHSSWANELAVNPFDPSGYDAGTSAGCLGVEFVTPAVTSPLMPTQAAGDKMASQLTQSHPHIKYADMWHRGFLLVDISRTEVVANWYHLDTIAQPSTNATLAKRFATLLNQPGLKELPLA